MNNEPIQCFICLQPVCVPIKIIAFPCIEQIGKPTCHDIQRACLCCARTFLELNKPQALRSNTKKCPFCPALCNPMLLNAWKAYRKDYLLMSIFNEKINCPYKVEGCPYQDFHMGIDKHLQSQCGFRYTKCSCGEFIKINLLSSHSKTCKDYSICNFCNESIHYDFMYSHIENKHYQKKCMYCQTFFTLSEINVHVHECPLKPIECQYCHLFFFQKNYKNHIYYEYEKQQQIIETTIKRLRLEQEKLNMIFKDFDLQS